MLRLRFDIAGRMWTCLVLCFLVLSGFAFAFCVWLVGVAGLGVLRGEVFRL